MILNHGNLDTALYARMAIPSLLNPEVINSALYVDGELVNNLLECVAKQVGEEFSLSSERYQPFGKNAEHFASACAIWLRPIVTLATLESDLPQNIRVTGLASTLDFGRIFGNWGQVSLKFLRGGIFDNGTR